MWPKRKASSAAGVPASGTISCFRTSVCRRLRGRARRLATELVTALQEKMCPTTAARCATSRSASSSWSRRAASSAWMVGGMASDRTSPVACQLPLRRTIRPSSMSMRTSSCDEQRIAIGGRQNALSEVARERHGVKLPGISSSATSAAERLQQERLALARGPTTGSPFEQLRTRRADEQQGDAARPAGEVLDEVEKRFLGPMHVVQDDHQRLAARECFEEFPDRPERLLQRARTRSATERGPEPLEDVRRALLAVEKHGHLAVCDAW